MNRYPNDFARGFAYGLLTLAAKSTTNKRTQEIATEALLKLEPDELRFVLQEIERINRIVESVTAPQPINETPA